MPDTRRRGSTPGATSRPCSTPPPRSSSPRASRRRCATSRPGRASGWARSTATSRRGRTWSSPSTATRSRPAPRPVRPCSASSATRTPRWPAWIDLFVDFLVTKHGLAAALRSDSADFDALHAYFLDRLLPVCAQLLDAAAAPARSAPTSGLRAHARRREPLHRGGARPALRRPPAGRAPRRGTALLRPARPSTTTWCGRRPCRAPSPRRSGGSARPRAGARSPRRCARRRSRWPPSGTAPARRTGRRGVRSESSSAGADGDSAACHSVSSASRLPTPASTDWSSSRAFTARPAAAHPGAELRAG